MSTTNKPDRSEPQQFGVSLALGFVFITVAGGAAVLAVLADVERDYVLSAIFLVVGTGIALAVTRPSLSTGRLSPRRLALVLLSCLAFGGVLGAIAAFALEG
jgi:hypothetical protein